MKRVAADIYGLTQGEKPAISVGPVIIKFLENLREVARRPGLIESGMGKVPCENLEKWIASCLVAHPELSAEANQALRDVRTALAAPAEAPTRTPAKKDKKKPTKAPRGGFVMDDGDETDGADDNLVYA